MDPPRGRYRLARGFPAAAPQTTLPRVSTSEREPQRRHRFMVEVPADLAERLQGARREDGVSPSRRMRALVTMWAKDEALQDRVVAELLAEQARRAAVTDQQHS